MASKADDPGNAMHTSWLPTLLVILVAAVPVANCDRRPGGNATSKAPVEDPPFSAEEEAVFSKVSARILKHGELLDSDIDAIRSAMTSFFERTGVHWTRSQVRSFIGEMNLVTRYNQALGRCLLYSIDSGQPSVFSDYTELRSKLERRGFARASKLDSDYELIIATAYGRESVDEHGQRHAPLTREAILESIRNLDRQDESYRKLELVLLEFSP